MTQTRLETIPVTWSDERDGAFFAIVQHVLRPAFASGATALLMSYDDDSQARPGPVAGPVPAHRMPAPLAPAHRS